MAIFAPPLSFSITEEHFLWLEQRRHRGALSRSAVLRQVLDDAIAAEQGPSSPPLSASAAAVDRH